MMPAARTGAAVWTALPEEDPVTDEIDSDALAATEAVDSDTSLCMLEMASLADDVRESMELEADASISAVLATSVAMLLASLQTRLVSLIICLLLAAQEPHLAALVASSITLVATEVALSTTSVAADVASWAETSRAEMAARRYLICILSLALSCSRCWLYLRGSGNRS